MQTRKLAYALAASAAAVAILALAPLRAADNGEADTKEEEKLPRYDLTEIMERGHKGKTSIAKKVVEGQSTKEEEDILLIYYTWMAKNKPPKGDEASWKKKTEALLVATQGIIDGKQGSRALLKDAVHCKSCHNVHKPD